MASSDEPMCLDLKHGVQLKLLDHSGRLGVAGVEDFFAEAVAHFKEHRDVLKTDRYTAGPYERTIRIGRKVLGWAQLSCANPAGITAALYVEAVIDAYAKLTTLGQMLEDLPVWREAAETQEGIVKSVVGLLAKRGGQLAAIAAWLTHDPAQGR